MTTVEDLLGDSSKKKKSEKGFTPRKRRVWDNLNISNDTEESTLKQEKTPNAILGEENATTLSRDRDSLVTKETDSSKIIENLRRTEGVQRKIMEKVTAHVRSSNVINNIVDIPINTLATKIRTDKGTLRTSIKRLKRKSILKKSEGVRGRKGYTRVQLPDFILKECLNLFQCPPQELFDISNPEEDVSETINQPISQSHRPGAIKLPESWSLINIDSLLEVGFSESHLKQLCDRELNTPEIVQSSINHFAFGLKYNPDVKKYTDPVKVLMGVLRRGEIWTESKYQSPNEIAQRTLLKAKKAERERIEKLEKEAFQLAFDEWVLGLSPEKIEQITPREGAGITPKRVRLQSYFTRNIWEGQKNDFLVL